jgi:glutamine amidotransferase
MERIAVIDYGMGNLRSVSKALECVADGRQKVVVSSDSGIIGDADRVVFPGQGAIRDCMAELRRLELEQVVVEALRTKPFLGICMGLQALMDQSEEDAETPGLSVFSGGVRRFPDNVIDERTGERLKVPHMGWNQVWLTGRHPMWKGIGDGERFYFVHSYYVDPRDSQIVAAHTQYAVDFACAIASQNVFAVQFHPEKSQRAGLTLLGNFTRWKPTAARDRN